LLLAPNCRMPGRPRLPTSTGTARPPTPTARTSDTNSQVRVREQVEEILRARLPRVDQVQRQSQGVRAPTIAAAGVLTVPQPPRPRALPLGARAAVGWPSHAAGRGEHSAARPQPCRVIAPQAQLLPRVCASTPLRIVACALPIMPMSDSCSSLTRPESEPQRTISSAASACEDPPAGLFACGVTSPKKSTTSSSTAAAFDRWTSRSCASNIDASISS